MADIERTASERRWTFYQDKSLQVFPGMILGVLIGIIWPRTAPWIGTLADLFIRLIAMFVGLIIFCSVVHGIATVREARRVGRVAIKALIYFEVVTSFALVIGLTMINLLGPGRGMHVNLEDSSDAALAPYMHTANEISASGFLMSIVPRTAFSAFTDGSALQVVFLSVLFAFGLLALGSRGDPVIALLEITKETVFKIIGYIMWLAPIGAMGAIAFTVGKFGFGTLSSLGYLVGEFYLTCILFVVLVLWPIAKWNRVNLWALARYIRTELLIVFGTSSSESVFPQLVKKLTSLGCDESCRPHFADWVCLQSRWYMPLFCCRLDLFGPGDRRRSVVDPATWASRHPVGDVKRRGRRCRFGYRCFGIDVGRDGNHSGGGRGTDSRRPPAPVLRLRCGNVLGNALATIVIGQWEGAVDRELLLAGLLNARR
jgi:Na+/H+-dicarboxylate symporter